LADKILFLGGFAALRAILVAFQTVSHYKSQVACLTIVRLATCDPQHLCARPAAPCYNTRGGQPHPIGELMVIRHTRDRAAQPERLGRRRKIL